MEAQYTTKKVILEGQGRKVTIIEVMGKPHQVERKPVYVTIYGKLIEINMGEDETAKKVLEEELNKAINDDQFEIYQTRENPYSVVIVQEIA